MNTKKKIGIAGNIETYPCNTSFARRLLLHAKIFFEKIPSPDTGVSFQLFCTG
jgi:hypothetical protein